MTRIGWNRYPPTLLADKYEARKAEVNARSEQLRANEEELNRIFAKTYSFDCAVVNSPYMGSSSFLSFFMFRHPAALGDARSSNAEELVLSNYDLAEHDRGLFGASWDFERYLLI